MALRDLITQLNLQWKRNGLPILVVATVDDAERLPPYLRSLFKLTMKFEVCSFSPNPAINNIRKQVPNELERFARLWSALQAVSPVIHEHIKDVAVQTAGFSASDIENLTWRSCESAYHRLCKAS